jgi:hypothetical protein
LVPETPTAVLAKLHGLAGRLVEPTVIIVAKEATCKTSLVHLAKGCWHPLEEVKA